VAGIAAGGVTTQAGRFSGVAPGAHVVNLRVLDDKGQGTTSDVIAAIEWAIANNYVSIVPCQYDLTAHHAISHINKEWDWTKLGD
jgi:subtilisin family serine protease